MSKPVLQTAVANYGHTNPLKDGSVSSEMFDMEHHEITPVPMIFRRMVRKLEFDVAEMALATYLTRCASFSSAVWRFVEEGCPELGSV